MALTDITVSVVTDDPKEIIEMIKEKLGYNGIKIISITSDVVREEDTKRCDECRYCVLRDYGYSNYTVEGTSVLCVAKMHPNDGFDRWYGESPEMFFAIHCKSYHKGTPVHFSVEGDER